MVTLEDKYELTSGRAVMTGVQALVRLLIDQRRADRRHGLNTGGFVSGYRGSPLGTFDAQLERAARHLSAHDIVFQPGLNEDLAATAVWGTQQVGLFPGARVEGVFGLWYGKSPGVDRSGDVFKHANFAGTSQHGGVLAIAGDDPSCKSSSLPSQSDYAFVDAEMPLLAPSSVDEVLEFGLKGFAMSRFAGCWVGMKTTADLMDSSAVVDVNAVQPTIVLPDDADQPWSGARHIGLPSSPHEQEERHRHRRLPAALAFSAANRLDRLVFAPDRPRLLIVTSGSAYWQVRQALQLLGLDEATAKSLGIGVYKVGLIWPLEARGLRVAAGGCEEVLVVEEKRPLIEDQLRSALFELSDHRRPRVCGKLDDQGRPLLSDLLGLDSLEVAKAIQQRLKRLRLTTPLALDVPEVDGSALPELHKRAPYFCSGCPHNRSTKVPQGSRALAGIGCHYLAQSMDRSTASFTQMGGEGITWIGQAPFTDEKHVFVNLGDGTYFHSGLLAIRQAVAAKATITYKILFNDAVAMTGGQKHDGELTVPAIVAQLAAEGVRRIAVVQEEARPYLIAPLPNTRVSVSGRDRMDAIQAELRAEPGVTAIIYDQVCATEKRRRRKRGLLPDTNRRAFINALVCEGCGDCTVKSNCVSVQPLETEFGRKRQIDQSSCNKDLTCTEGFCPSFVTVVGGRLRKHATGESHQFDSLPHPTLPELPSHGWDMMLTGIGGQGVTSIGAISAMAAHLDGLSVKLMDITGMAQKGGGVFTFVRLAPADVEIHGPRTPDGGADLVMAGDMVVTAERNSLRTFAPGRTQCVLNDALVPTAEFIRNPDVRYQTPALKDRIKQSSKGLDLVPAADMATRRLGDSVFANMIMLGFAWQKGLIPLSEAALLRAVELNGTAVEANKQAFNWGRLAAHDPAAAAREETPPPLPASLDELIARRRAFLTHYQDAAYAERYLRLVSAVRDVERAMGGERLSEAVARAYFKLLAYKDEYEVARLYTDGRFRDALAAQFDGNYRLELNLAPPLWAKRDPHTGVPRKRAYGPWMLQAFRLLAKMRVLRGSWADPFGYTAERRMERQLIRDYEARIRMLLPKLTRRNVDVAVKIASLPEQIRGFGHVKDANVQRAEAALAALLAKFDDPAGARQQPNRGPERSAIASSGEDGAAAIDTESLSDAGHLE